MTPRSGQRIVSLHPGLAQPLQDELLGAIETVLVGAEADRIWIEESPTHDLRVHAELPPTDRSEASIVPIETTQSAPSIRSSMSVGPSTADQATACDHADTGSVE